MNEDTVMIEHNPTQVVKDVYAAFHRADVPAILARLAPDIDWRWPPEPGIPHSGNRRGVKEVGAFFETYAATEEPLAFTQDAFVADGDCVVVLGNYRARVKATGRIWESGYAHVWTVRDGRIAGCEVRHDTAAAVEAYARPAAGSLRDADVGAIARARNEWIDALNSDRVDGLMALETEDAAVFPPHEAPVVGRGASRAWHEALVAQFMSRIDVTAGEVVGAGDLAVDRFSYSIRLAPRAGGSQIDDSGNCLWVWRRQADGAWKIARAIWNSDRPLPAPMAI